MSVSVPVYWSVAKLKALITSVNSKMNFHQIDITRSRMGQKEPVELWVRRDASRTDTACFEQYYKSQVQPLTQCLKSMPIQPLLHPNYHSFAKAAEPVSQQPVQQPNRQEQPAEAQVEGGLGLGGMMGVDDQNQMPANGGGIFDRLGFYFIRIIQILSILTILQFITYHSDYYNVIVFVGVIVAYFTIEWFKAKAKQQQN